MIHQLRTRVRSRPTKMAPLRLLIEQGKFVDASGRQVILRGINVAGDAKYPSEPFDQPSQVTDDFFDGDNVSFHKRPFTKEDAHVHFARLRRFGYNTIRYIFTWEAIEARGPGIYDEEWINHTIEVLRTAKDYGFFVYMDPHQDVVRPNLNLAVRPQPQANSILFEVVTVLWRLWRPDVDALPRWPEPTVLRRH